MNRPELETPIKDLICHRAQLERHTMRELFAANPCRFELFSLEACGLLLDYSRNRATSETMQLLTGLAEAAGVRALRDGMLAGEAINLTEGRAVLHTALRAPKGANVMLGGRDVVPDVHLSLIHI